IFGAGAVLYSVLENSFPAHGVLSQISKRCPDALKWVVRRAMADYDNRYETAGAMLTDLRFLRDASDPFAVRVADLPSMRGVAHAEPAPAVVADDATAHAPFNPVREERAGSPVPPPQYAAPGTPEPSPAAARTLRPNIVVTNWWSGAFRVGGNAADPADTPFERAARKAEEFLTGHKRARVGGGAAATMANTAGRTAAEQLARARARAHAAQERAHARMRGRRQKSAAYGAQVNAGVTLAVLIFLGGCVFLASIIVGSAMRSDRGDAIAFESEANDVVVEVATADAAQTTITIDAETAREFARAFADMKIEWDGDLSRIGENMRAVAARFAAARRAAARQGREPVEAPEAPEPPEFIEHDDIRARAPIALPPGSRVVSGGNVEANAPAVRV